MMGDEGGGGDIGDSNFSCLKNWNLKCMVEILQKHVFQEEKKTAKFQIYKYNIPPTTPPPSQSASKFIFPVCAH